MDDSVAHSDRLALDRAQQAHFARLAEQMPDPDMKSGRVRERIPWLYPRKVSAELSSSESITRTVVLYPINISRSGAGVLYWAYLQPGMKCDVFLGMHDHGVAMLHSVVVRARLLQGKVHEIGLRFDPDELSDEVFRAITATGAELDRSAG